MTIINWVAIARFFKAIYTSIFKCFFIIGSTNRSLLKPVKIYFKIVKTNNWKMLYLHFMKSFSFI